MGDDLRIYSALHAAGMKVTTYPLDTQNIIEVNKALMRRLHYSGTPTTIIGDRVLTGEVTYDLLEEAVNIALAGINDSHHLADLQQNKIRTE